MRSHEDRGAFDRRSARPFEEIALPARSSGPPVHATHTPSIKKSVRAFATWSASAFCFRSCVPGVTCQALGSGSIDRREKGVRFRLPLTLAGQSQRLRRLL